MRLFTRLLPLALFCLFASPVFSQNILITYQKSDSLFVCGTDTFFVKVQNIGAGAISGASLNIALPTGITYLPGTVAGAVQQNINNLQQPVFGLPNLASGATASVALLIAADCAAADALDAGELFIANISVQSGAGNVSVATSNFAVETGLLLLESIDDELMNGEKGDTLLRTICVKNTRLGKIGSLHFEDAHQNGLEISIANAANQTNTPALFAADFNSNFFTAFGDGDTWLELNEKACFTEKIVITDCGIPEFTNPSLLRVGWGCGGEICRYDSALVAIEIKKSTRVPDLVFAPIWNAPTDYCGNTPALTGLKINNIGKADATEIFVGIEVVQDILAKVGMGSNSFRLVHNGVTTPLLPSLVTSGNLPLCDKNVAQDVSLVVPHIAAKDSLLLLFDTYTCENSCEQVLPFFLVEYFYRKSCPVNGFVSDTLVIEPDGNSGVYSFVGTNAAACFQFGQSYLFNYAVYTNRALQDDGFLHLELDLPHGLSLDDSCSALLSGVASDVKTVTPKPGGGYLVHFAWALPLPNDSLYMTFCLRYNCDTNIVCLKAPEPPDGGEVLYAGDCGASCFLQINSRSFWTPSLNTPYQCAIGDCDSLRVAVRTIGCIFEDDTGPIDTTVVDPIFPLPGFKKWFDVYRLNYGFQDDNNDRYADNGAASAIATGPEIRRDRFLPGDTLRVEYGGVVDSGGGLFYFGRTIWHEVVSSDMGGPEDNDFIQTSLATSTFANSSKFRFVRDSISIRYADGSVHGCMIDDLFGPPDDQNYFSVNQVNTWPPEVLDDLVSQRFRFIFSLAILHQEGCLPKPTLDFGDSLFLYTDFKLDFNYRPTSNNNPDPPLIGFRTAASSGGKTYAYNIQPFKKLQYSGIRTTRSPNQHSIRACENSLEVKKFRQLLRIARENMFPYEVRPIARISEYFQTVPLGIEAASVKLEYLTLQDSVPRFSNLNLPFTQTPNALFVNFDPAFDDPVDEGFTLRTNIAFKPDCQYNKPDSSRQLITLEYTNCFNGDTCTVKDSIISSLGFFSNAPDLRFETVDSIVVSPSKEFDLEFDLKNYVVSPAFNSWVAVVSQSGSATGFEIIQLPQNQSIAGQNNIFQTGQINGFGERAFRLKGLNVACDADTLMLIFGWNCAPISGLDQTTCGRDTYYIELRLETPELELEVLQEPASIPVCDTSDWYEFEIYNAKNGYAYDPFATVKLPPGLFMVPGSCQISYPAGSAFLPINDPESLPGNLFQWNITALQATIAANGLPGVDLDPQNTFRIRFRTYAECGFVSNTQVIYGVRGTESCGRSTNVLNKPGEPLKINGLNPSYGVVVGIQPVGASADFCGGTQQFSVKLTLLGPPSEGDSVYVLLPQGVTYSPGSYQPVQNAPSGPPDLEGQVLRLALPTNVSVGAAMEFRFSTTFEPSAGCVDQTLIVQTRVRTEAFCPTLGAPCTVYAATGEAIWNISLQNPELGLGGASATVAGNQINTTILVNNIGLVPASGATAQIWQDVDGDGAVSPDDILLQTVENNQIFPPGGSIAMVAGLNIDPSMLCNLIVVLPAAENCVCADKVLPLNSVTLQYERKEYCEYQTVAVGVTAQPGFTYQWIPSDNFSCDTCATTDLILPVPPLPGVPISLVLVETSGECTVQHRFELVFGAAASLVVNDPAICKGETAILTANPSGASYQWLGTGIVDPTLQQQTVMPSASSNYSVTVTFTNGCTAAFSSTIQVAQPDTVQLPGLVTCEGEPVNVLGTTTATPGTYALMLQNGSGCDSVIYQSLNVLPRPFIEENRAFCTGDTLAIFDTLVTQSGQVCRTYTAANGCDSLHCINVTAWDLPALSDLDTIVGTIGQPVSLQGPDGYTNYTWVPSVPNCPNCQDVTITTDSSYLEYQLIVADANGCEGAITYRILLFPPCGAQRMRIPNAFTPNNDAVNDVFRVVPYEGLEIIGSLTIYNRWGEKVYEDSGKVFWDGVVDGKPAPSDVYVYRIDVICDGKREAVWGDVALLR